MIDHIGINVSDFEHSKNFYAVALAPLGYQLVKEYDHTATGIRYAAGFGVDGKADFWIVDGKVNIPPIHVAFTVESCEKVNAFYTDAINEGGRDNGAPSWRSHYYHSQYYGALVLDPDGHNIEAVCYALS
ncbi:VOC family protein [Anabaena sp. CCY 0017]|uniref:VOC family protein n=1 Tax=Anabaena sp. CCY 0017 TaxID=3103866 RepID=UPI0039C5CB9E